MDVPADVQPLREAIHALFEGRAQGALFTNAAQVEHLLRVAADDGTKERLLEALGKVVVASIGPTCSETLVEHEIAIDLEPAHPKMGPLVQETAERATEILRKKSGGRARRPEWKFPRPVSQIPIMPPWRDSRFLKACRKEAVDATPIWLMRQADRYMKDYRELRPRAVSRTLQKPRMVSRSDC